MPLGGRHRRQLTSRLVGAADLVSGRVEAVDLLVLRRAGGVAGTAGLLAGVSSAADGLCRLVSRGILAADKAKEVANRGLHDLGLIGRGFRDGVCREGENRQRGDRLGEHCWYWKRG